MKADSRRVSMAAIAIASLSLGWGAPALAQEAQLPQTAPAEQADDDAGIVVTGSLIRGTPLDTALPVEVYSQVEMERRGSPNALDFAKSLTISGPTTGESYYFGGPASTGSVQYNLRGLGASKTLVLLNGRRMNINTANVPSIAMGRVEILKDGAAVTYGADATGGVVNFITRDRFVGLTGEARYKFIDGSKGDYYAGLLAGVGSGDVNIMASVEYERRSRLKAIERDFVRESLDPTKAGYNPAPWSTLTNLTGWTVRGPLPASPSVANEFGAAIGYVTDFTPASCAAVGGRYDNAYTCAYNYISYYDLVSKTDTWRGYLQISGRLNDDISFHVDGSYARVTVPEIIASPSQPVVNGPAMATGAVDQFYVPITNPYAAAFATRNGIVGASGFTPTTYRMLGHGGNNALTDDGYGVPDRADNEVFRVSANVNGKLGDWAGFARNVNFDAAATYNNVRNYLTHPDTLGFRLQQALNGFGGAGCNAPDLDPNRFGTQNPALAGVGNCKYWNPFSSSFANQPVLGLANPNYVAGSENSKELIRWMFSKREQETVSQDLTVDLVFSGKSGIVLPGGDVSWALGGQLRWFDVRSQVLDPYDNGTVQCEWPHGTTSTNGVGSTPMEANPLPTTSPNYRGCTPNAPGPFVLFAPIAPYHLERQQKSVFGEIQIPVFDQFSIQAAARREEFSGGLSATVYKVAGKFNVFGPLTLRASYGTNYQTPPLGTVPGQVNVAARNITIAGGNWLAANFVTAASIKPETATTANVGAVWDSGGFGAGHRFHLSVDYFDIRTKDEVGQLADPNQIANLVFNGAGGTITTCNASTQPLLNRITFNAGCAVGMSAVGSFSAITTVVGNGPGQTTNGFDVQAAYTLPLGGGELGIHAAATILTALRTGPTSLDGVVISTGDNRLGTLNFATFANAAPKVRANGNLNYNIGGHNIRATMNYISAVTDERAGIQYGEKGRDWVTFDLAYRFALSDNLALTAGVTNLLDRDPPRAQEEYGFDPWMANGLGRVVQLGIKAGF